MKALNLFRTAALGTACASFAMLTGCAHPRPPQDLVEAREAYQAAATSPGVARAEPELEKAKDALQHAEVSFKDSGDSRATRDWSYIASRRAGSARAKANAVAVLEDEHQAKAELAALMKQQQQELREARRETVDQSQLTREALAKIAGMSAKQSSRGLVLTLSGSVLFASGKSTLLPAAQERLNQAAQALAKDNHELLVTGYTDSTGSDELNMRLSRERAEAVRTYLTTHGVDPSRVTAEGMGKADPIADNKTAEGRADNRRVEITIENAGANGNTNNNMNGNTNNNMNGGGPGTVR